MREALAAAFDSDAFDLDLVNGPARPQRRWRRATRDTSIAPHSMLE